MRAVAGPVLALVLLVGCGGGPRASASPGMFSPGVLPTADQLCQLLTPADWTAAGLADAHAPGVDFDEPGSAYCTYGTDSGASGGLELDVFVGATVDDAKTTFATIAQSLPPSTAPNLSGIDDGLINANVDPGFGAILVRTGKLVVTVTLPSSSNATNQLTSLTALVLSRAASLE